LTLNFRHRSLPKQYICTFNLRFKLLLDLVSLSVFKRRLAVLGQQLATKSHIQMKVILFLGLWYIFASVVSTNTSEEPQFPIDSGISKSVACTRLQNLQDNEDFTFSQNGEDGLLLGLLDILGMENSSRTYVEFGVESGVQCNTRILREALGFSGLSMDGGHQNERINLQQEFITESNIIALFEKYSVPGNVDVLSVDVDMFDFWILSRILQNGKYRPRIIIVETNPSLCVSAYKREYRHMNSVPLTVVHPTQTNQTVWDGTRYAGTCTPPV